jgi:hypothetical protein
MKLVTFDGVFVDGLHPITGHAFEIAGRTYVVHKGREPHEKEYWVSEMATGLKVEIARTHNRAVAIEWAKNEIAAFTNFELRMALDAAAMRRDQMKASQAKK